jgi:hypothetical protein
MNMQPSDDFSQDFEGLLIGYYGAPAPAEQFSRDLEAHLRQRQIELLDAVETGRHDDINRWQHIVHYFDTHRWRAVAISLFLATILALGLIGPQRVLAEVQRLFSYIPGVGFVDLEQTRVLVSPVEVRREGITLRVEQVIAEKDRTLVLFSTQGLPPEDQLRLDFNTDYHLNAYLRLPGGDTMESREQNLRVGAGKLEFPGLPEGIYRVTLELDSLPLTPAGDYPEDWRIPLNLRIATGKLAGEMFPQPYSSPNASDTQHRITLRVLNVAQSREETAVQWQVELPEADWGFSPTLGSYRSPILLDELGHVYNLKRNRSGSTDYSQVTAVEVKPGVSTPKVEFGGRAFNGTEVFAPLSTNAHQITLRVDELKVELPVDLSFTFDPGEQPQLGDVWPLDIHLNADGFPLHVVSARWVGPVKEYGEETGSVLVFRFDPLPEQDDRQLEMLSVGDWPEGFNGGGSQSGADRFELRFTLPTGAFLPAKPINVNLNQANVFINGPWQVRWQIPGAQQLGVAPLQMHLPDASQQVGNVELGVDEVVMSDQLTAVHLATPGQPAGTRIEQILPYRQRTFDFENYDPEIAKRAISLHDDRGREYLTDQTDVVWGEQYKSFEFDPSWINFGSLQPFARQLTLQFPAVVLTVPGEAAFDVVVPNDLALHPVQTTVKRYESREIGIVEDILQIQASDSWEVDIPLEIAGYHLRFTKAKVEYGSPGSENDYRLVLSGEALISQQDGQYLSTLRFSRIERPDGQVQEFGNSPNRIGRANQPVSGIDGQNVTLELDITTSNGLQMLTGRYRVSLNGVSVWVPGPWRINWSVMGQ